MTVELQAPPAKLTFTKDEKSRLQAAAAEIERLENRLVEIEALRNVITSAEADFVSGKLDITEAAGLLSVTNDVNARNALQMRLRSPVKQAMKASVQSVADLLAKADQHRVDALAAQAKDVETSEREGFDTHGLNQDEFRPSPLLLALREKHRRALDNSKRITYTKQSLTTLLDLCDDRTA
ncbi:MAG: hypothetical protein O3A82_17435 [Verrucomicrobia bacterium]|nr:hypothetical protein [Verrucomicrobiota bacterium]